MRRKGGKSENQNERKRKPLSTRTKKEEGQAGGREGRGLKKHTGKGLTVHLKK